MAILTQHNIQMKRPPLTSDPSEHCHAAGSSTDTEIQGQETLWGSATAMSSVRTHAPGATPCSMHLGHGFVAWGGEIIVGIKMVSTASSTLPLCLFDVK
jgi:hypothetical protein